MAGDFFCSEVVFVNYKLISVDDKAGSSHECEQWLLHIPPASRY
jgi:hypothetical protein